MPWSISASWSDVVVVIYLFIELSGIFSFMEIAVYRVRIMAHFKKLPTVQAVKSLIFVFLFVSLCISIDQASSLSGSPQQHALSSASHPFPFLRAKSTA